MQHFVICILQHGIVQALILITLTWFITTLWEILPEPPTNLYHLLFPCQSELLDAQLGAVVTSHMNGPPVLDVNLSEFKLTYPFVPSPAWHSAAPISISKRKQLLFEQQTVKLHILIKSSIRQLLFFLFRVEWKILLTTHNTNCWKKYDIYFLNLIFLMFK